MGEEWSEGRRVGRGRSQNLDASPLTLVSLTRQQDLGCGSSLQDWLLASAPSSCGNKSFFDTDGRH